jgi:GT2 family glycosyltransferase
MASWERTNAQQTQLAILTPVGGFVQFLASLMVKNLVVPLPYVWHCTSGYPIDISRDHLVRKALEDNVDYVFFLDTDVIPPHEVLVHLLAWKLPIVSALYWSKARLPCAYKFTEDHKHVESIDPKSITQRIMEVDAVGTGCLLIDARLFKKIPPPWFKWDMLPWASKDEVPGHSEDINFCLKAKEHGYPTFLDTAMRCKHLLEGSYSLDENGEFIAVL